MYRFVILFFTCMMTFGSYFCFDMPSVLQSQFQGVRIPCVLDVQSYRYITTLLSFF